MRSLTNWQINFNKVKVMKLAITLGFKKINVTLKLRRTVFFFLKNLL